MLPPHTPGPLWVWPAFGVPQCAPLEGIGFTILTFGPLWSYLGQQSHRFPLKLPPGPENGYLVGDDGAIHLPAPSPLGMFPSRNQTRGGEKWSRIGGNKVMLTGGR